MKLSRLCSSFAVFACAFSLSHCKTRQPGSGLRDLSDQLKQKLYTIEGDIDISLGIDEHLIAFALDDLKPLVFSPNDKPTIDRFAQLYATKDSLQQRFNELRSASYPLVDTDGKPDLRKMSYWLPRQILYAETYLAQSGLSMVYENSVDNPPEFSPQIKDDQLSVHYKIKLTALASSTGVELTPDKKLPVPRNELRFYFDQINPSFDLARAKQLLNSSNLNEFVSYLTQHLNKTNGTTNKERECQIEYTDSLLSPGNFYWYYRFRYSPIYDLGYNPSNRCLKGTTTVSAIESSEKISKNSYPEYHRLFADKKVDAVIYYNHMGHVEGDRAKDAIKYFTTDDGFKLTDLVMKNADSNQILGMADQQNLYDTKNNLHEATLVKENRGIVFTVRILVNEEYPEAEQKFIRALGTDSIVIYDGHAGQSTAINKAIADPNTYQPSKYQIFMFYACGSRNFALNLVLPSKAARDFDIYSQNLDVISTTTMISGHRAQLGLIYAIDQAISYYDKTEAEWPQDALYDLSWLGITKRMNDLKNKNGNQESYFLVSGEDNDYRPGKLSYERRNIDESTIRTILRSSSEQISTRKLAFLTLMQRAQASSKTYEDFSGRVKDLCGLLSKEDFGKVIEGNGVISTDCKILRWRTSEPGVFTYGNLQFKTEKGVDFYSNGKVFYGCMVNPTIKTMTIQLGVLELMASAEKVDDCRYVSFNENGLLQSAKIVSQTPIPFLSNGVILPPNSDISIGERALIRSIKLPSDFEKTIDVSGFKLNKNSGMEFSDGGRIRSVSHSSFFFPLAQREVKFSYLEFINTDDMKIGLAEDLNLKGQDLFFGSSEIKFKNNAIIRIKKNKIVGLDTNAPFDLVLEGKKVQWLTPNADVSSTSIFGGDDGELSWIYSYYPIIAETAEGIKCDFKPWPNGNITGILTPKGQILACTVLENFEKNGLKCNKGDLFSRNGGEGYTIPYKVVAPTCKKQDIPKQQAAPA